MGWLAVLLCTAAAVPSAAELHAERLSPENLAERRLGGTDAIGGLDDWVLGNGTLCAVVSDPAHENAMSAEGGVLVDLGHCGRSDDQFVLAAPTFNLRGQKPPADRVTAELDEGRAAIVVSGETGGLRFETRYAVGLEEPHVLDVRTQVERVAEGEPLLAIGETVLHPSASMASFAVDTQRRVRSVGFVHPAPSREARPGPAPDLHVFVGDDGVEPGVAYGRQFLSARIERADGETRELSPYTSNGASYSAIGALAAPGSGGAPPAPAALGPGDRLVFERRLWLGDRADVASVTDRVFDSAPRVTGQLGDPGARLHVDGADGNGAVTELRPDADGGFELRLPPGRYGLRAVAPGGSERKGSVTVGEQGARVEPMLLGPVPRLRLPRGGPMRLVFIGQGGTETPVFRGDLLGRRFGSQAPDAGGRSNDVSLAGLPDDPRDVPLAPGRYRVYATRGPEFTVTSAEIELAAGQEATLEIEEPVRAVETPGWISADFHVHSALSFDSGLAPRLRVGSFLAQGAEVMVATEHDRVVDYAPLLRELGADGAMASMVGVELTGSVRSAVAPHTIGHANVFPLPYRPERYRGGAPRGEGVRLRGAIGETRALGGRRVFQVNHPRGVPDEQADGSFFSHLSVGNSFDPRLPLDHPNNSPLLEADPETGLRDIDFDAVELMNGPPLDYYRLVRADWLSFLLQGRRITAMANSDSHRLRSLVGLPRTYVRVADDDVRKLDEAAFIDAVLAGRAYGSTGPLLEVWLGDAGIGERFQGDSGDLQLRVRAAPWVPVSSARVYVNGELAAESPVGPDEPLEIPLRFDTDAFVTVEVEGEPGEVYGHVAPGFTPFAFTNPIWVDADSDGSWQAPGLPAELPPALTDPLGPQ